MKTKLFISIILLTILSINVSGQANKTDNQWKLHKEQQGVQIYFKYTDCNIPSEGYYQQQVLLKFVNTTQTPLKVKWQKEAWYEGKCATCGKDEYKFELKIPAGETIVGECDIYSPSYLKIFSKFLDFDAKVQLEKFNLDIIEVTPY